MQNLNCPNCNKKVLEINVNGKAVLVFKCARCKAVAKAIITDNKIHFEGGMQNDGY